MEISVVIIAYNEQGSIKKCLDKVLSQTFTDFELVFVDDGSTDQTMRIVQEYGDRRIKYIRQDKNCGLAASRNKGIAYAQGKYIFFTDADCMPIKYWLEGGFEIFKIKKCAGVVGRTFYDAAEVTISDRIMENVAGDYGCGNIAYTKEILKRAGGFYPKYRYGHEDLDLGLRVRKYGEIFFCEDMIVVHQPQKYSAASLFRQTRKACSTVHFFKDHFKDYRDTLWGRQMIWGRVSYPKKFLILIFPFLLIPYYSFKSWRDIKLLPAVYLSTIYLRLIIWKEAIKERIFLI